MLEDQLRSQERPREPPNPVPVKPGPAHTYASLRCACRDDVRYTADQLGHEDPRFTLKVYAQATKRRERLNTTHRRAYDAALSWARMTNDSATISRRPRRRRTIGR